MLRVFSLSSVCRTSVQSRFASTSLDAKDWKEKVLGSTKPTVVDFYASWCGPCKTLGPVMDAIHDQHADKIDFYVLDVDSPGTQPILQEMKLSSIPDVRLFHKGKETDRFVGNLPEASVKKFFENAAKLVE